MNRHKMLRWQSFYQNNEIVKCFGWRKKKNFQPKSIWNLIKLFTSFGKFECDIKTHEHTAVWEALFRAT